MQPVALPPSSSEAFVRLVTGAEKMLSLALTRRQVFQHVVLKPAIARPVTVEYSGTLGARGFRPARLTVISSSSGSMYMLW